MSQFTDILVVSPLADGRTWVIRSQFGYDVGHEGSTLSVEVPVGFQTDFASVPRFLWWLFPKWGKYGNAAVVHDYLYWARPEWCSRKRADQVFREAMGVLGVGKGTIHCLYFSVRLFGWLAWRGKKAARVRSIPRKSIEARAW